MGDGFRGEIKLERMRSGEVWAVPAWSLAPSAERDRVEGLLRTSYGGPVVSAKCHGYKVGDRMRSYLRVKRQKWN